MYSEIPLKTSLSTGTHTNDCKTFVSNDAVFITMNTIPIWSTMTDHFRTSLKNSKTPLSWSYGPYDMACITLILPISIGFTLCLMYEKRTFQIIPETLFSPVDSWLWEAKNCKNSAHCRFLFFKLQKLTVLNSRFSSAFSRSLKVKRDEEDCMSVI